MKSLLVSLTVFSFGIISAQMPADTHIRWGERDDSSYVELINGKFGIVMHGVHTIETKYQIEDFEDAINYDGNAYFSDSAAFALGVDGKWGVMNNRGQIIVPFEYDYIRMERTYPDDRLQYAGVEKNGKCAIMDGEGKLMTGYDFDAFYGFYENDGMLPTLPPKLTVLKDGKIQFFDPETKTLSSEAPEMEFGVDVKIMHYKMKYGVISRTGEIILPFEYSNITSANYMHFESRDQLLAIFKDGKCGIWQDGKGLILPIEYSSALVVTISKKLYFIVSQNGKYALIDYSGKNITGFQYTYLSVFIDKITGMKGDDEYDISLDGSAKLITK